MKKQKKQFFLVRWFRRCVLGSRDELPLEEEEKIQTPMRAMVSSFVHKPLAMIDALGMDYIRTARAKGLKEKVVIYSHAWRNALLPVVTSIIGWFISIFSGSVIVETTFSLNGMGKLYWTGLNNLDFELVLAIQMFYTVVALMGSLIMDISYGLVDPRVRVDK